MRANPVKSLWLLTAWSWACAGVAPAAAVETVAGRVYLDANGNGRRDSGEPGLPNVRVTDGVGLAVTGADGGYRLRLSPDLVLPVPGTQTVALCWPSGKWPTTRTWMRIKDMPDATQMDFGLRDDPGQKLPFTYLHVTDNHDWRSSHYRNQHEMVNLYLKEAKFIINTGDMGLGGETPAKMEAYAADLTGWRARCAMPTFGTIGNHDTDTSFGKDHEYTFCGGYAALLGPLRFSFDYAGVHFVFADVLDDDPARNDFTAGWLEQDFAGLKPGARIILSYHYPNPSRSEKFLRVIRDHKVELIHAGHNHAYVYWPDFAAPMITAYARSSGSAGVMVVDQQRTNIGFFCDGCNADGPHSCSHSRRCPVEWRTHILESCIKPLLGPRHEVKDVKLAGAGQPVPVATDAVYVTARIVPGTATATGVKLGPADAPLSVAFTGRHVVVDGVPMPMLIPERDNGELCLYVFARKDMLTVWANNVLLFEKPVRFRKAVAVSAFADGGEATLRALDVREVNDDPKNSSNRYFCPCGHGALQRVP